jgi:hypothetical protein
MITTPYHISASAPGNHLPEICRMSVAVNRPLGELEFRRLLTTCFPLVQEDEWTNIRIERPAIVGRNVTQTLTAV